MAYNKNDKADGAKFRRGGMRRRKKVCVFCGEKNGTIDYKDVNKLKRYVSERGKILPRRITGNCLLRLHRIKNEIPSHVNVRGFLIWNCHYGSSGIYPH